MLSDKITDILGEKVESTAPISGGSIGNVYKVKLLSGKVFFAKTLDLPLPRQFEVESKGLELIRGSGVISAPKVIHVSENLLILEYIESLAPTEAFFYQFGRSLAQMHLVDTGVASYGLDIDGYIGLNPQKNSHMTDWREFFWKNRLLFQFDMLKANGYVTEELAKLFFKFENKFYDLIPQNITRPSLLHGDLWCGNFISSVNGLPYLIDPAPYYGDREADLAMTKLFGGFSQSFYRGYSDVYPLSEGYEKREGIYKLYHLMNHLNLFGRSYYGQVISTLKLY